MEPTEHSLPYWLNIKQASKLTQISISTLKRRCAAGDISPKCGRRFGRVWRFKRDIILNDGLILVKQ